MRVPQRWSGARATLAFAALIALAWAAVSLLGLSDLAVIWGGFIPGRVGGIDGDAGLAPVLFTPLTATLVHAGLIHLAFNLVIHLFCGRAVENIIGPVGLVILYVAGAYAAAAAQYLATPDDLIPMVGASGAISAILGAYALLFGRNRVSVADPRLALWLNALWLAGAFVILQLLIGVTFEVDGSRVAIFAHIGGFLAGLALAKPLLLFRYRRA